MTARRVVYSVSDYGAMIGDEVRMHAFVQALRSAVRPGSVVVDIGTGTGIFALLACQFGARRVFAIEPDDVIQVAREIAVANGHADRIEFLQALSTEVHLSERADVIVSDIGGALPWFGRHLPAIVDARRRFLAAGGVLIPQADTAWMAVADVPAVYGSLTDPWHPDRFHLDMSAARQLVVNTWTTCRVTSDQLLTKPERWGRMDYREIEHTDVHAKLRCTVTQAGTGHGLAAGFDRTVSEGWYLSNAPDASEAIRPKRIYGIVFFPWERPVVLDPGDVVDVELSATLAGEDYVWSWKTRVLDAGRTDSVKARFEQSTFHGTPLSLAQLRKKAEGYAPTLNVEGQVVRFVLDAMQGSDSVGDIADGLLQQFPVRFTGRADALSYVARLSKEFG